MNGRRVIVTGASSGIGEGIVRRFARLGARVALFARRRELLEEIAAEIERDGGTALVVAGDVTRAEDLDRVVATAVEQLGGVDILINNAGVAGPVSFVETPPERVRSYLETNFLGAVELCRRVLPVMERQGGGHIINVASFAGLKGLPTYATYGASKAALICFSDALRHEVAKHGIRITVLCPPGVDTPMVRDVIDDHAPWFFKFRIATVDEMVDAVVRIARRPRRFLVVPTLDLRLAWALLRFLPRTVTKIMTRLYPFEE